MSEALQQGILEHLQRHGAVPQSDLLPLVGELSPGNRAYLGQLLGDMEDAGLIHREMGTPGTDPIVRLR